MADKFNHKYRIPSARLQSWDYGSSALYFVTICTKNRDPHFGEIINGEIHLSEIGKIVHSEWFKTFDMRPDMNLEMDAFIIMPNHFHAIIFIGENRFNSGRDAMHCVSTGENIKNKFGRQSKNLASVIRGFKISVTTNARKINPNFAWQPRFHDHIIRNQNSLHNIQNYIINNPQKWMDDTFIFKYNMTDSTIISKIWNLANVLRDDGVGYGDYLEQITYLLFLKMADELNKPPYSKGLVFPKLKDVEGKEIPDSETCNWETLSGKRGAELESFYSQLLRTLSTEKGTLGQIFTKSQNKIQDPAKLSKVINLIDKENWAMMGADIKGKIYEGLLEKNAEDTKSGAGQYFTPRALIKTIVACVQPKPNKTISDPACGTGGFFLAAYDWIVENNKLDRDEKEFLKNKTFHGNEIVANTRRMCLMNMYLHNIGEIDGESFINPNDALIADDGSRYDYVLANPPFGKKSSMTSTNEQGAIEKEDLSYNRQDFWETSSNKQLNFLQHIKTQLKINGEAAVVLPDNVLFEGGAGEEVRKQLLKTTELHTILRLPTGIFYAQGVKANVLFFNNKPASKDPWTKEIWFYDYRTNVHHTPKKNPMRQENLAEFIELYKGNNINKREETWSAENEDGRWRKYTYDDVIARDKTSLDIFWLKDKSLTDLDNLPDPDILAGEIIENIESGLNSFREIMETINGEIAE